MRLSKIFGRTLREMPAEAETVSHQLLLRAGMIQQVAAGVYAYLPLAWRVLRKIEKIVREEMDSAGGQELLMPVLQPLEMWEESGRDEAFGKSLFVLSDRRDRKLVLGPTHEEVVTELARRNIRSYRDLPLRLYQIQTKFRDEPRPRGGLMRVREFGMKDLYSFDSDEEGLDRSYRTMMQAYKNLYKRCGLTAMMVEADSGAIGGKESHEFMVLAETGEDAIIFCPNCGYAANVEKATAVKPVLDNEPMREPEEVATPGAKTIRDVANLLGIPESRTLKAVFYRADGNLVFVTIRGDLEVNEVKLKNALKVSELRLANEDEVREAGLVAGAASAVGLKGLRIIADDSVTLGRNFVAGANREDTHLRNVNYERDFGADLVTDIALASSGQRCAVCGAELSSTRGVEVGHIFKLGTIFSQRQGALFLDRDGLQKPLVMGCYGIGIGRLLAAAIEQNHDEKGIIWPVPIAPYQAHLCALGVDDEEVGASADRVYEELQEAGIEVLYDDRAESPGVKFNDADLLGMPVRIVVSRRTLKSGCAELRPRSSVDSENVALELVAERLTAVLEGLR
ncbi:MAG: proline--tRNA ligase [Dehalococcoidia bacterium]|nr:proline--tRNA ligase [Dehalococcoidia bacterium]